MHAALWFLAGLFCGVWLGWVGFAMMDLSAQADARDTAARQTIDLTHDDHGGTPHDD